jgi:hypothetical protein
LCGGNLPFHFGQARLSDGIPRQRFVHFLLKALNVCPIPGIGFLQKLAPFFFQSCLGVAQFIEERLFLQLKVGRIDGARSGRG